MRVRYITVLEIVTKKYYELYTPGCMKWRDGVSDR